MRHSEGSRQLPASVAARGSCFMGKHFIPGSEGRGRDGWMHASYPHCLERYLFCFLVNPWSYTCEGSALPPSYIFQEENSNGLNDQMLRNTFEE